MQYDINNIRDNFPILRQEIYKRPFIYLDSAASSQKVAGVLEKEKELHRNYYGNIHRAAHYMADKATIEFENVREKIRSLINARSTKEVIFTKGTTDSINLVATSFCEKFLKEGDEIIVTEMEHHSNIVPWQLAAKRHKARVVKFPFDDNGVLMMDKLPELITPKTRLIAVAHVSNVLGTVNPVEEISRIASDKGIAVFVDGAQAVQHMEVDVRKLDIDFYAFSAHKMYGPNGVGVLYGKEPLLNEMPPYQGGGEMISEVSFDGTTFNDLPYKFEAGTPHITGVIAFGAAIDFMIKTGLPNINKWEQELLEYATGTLQNIDGLTIYGNAPEKSGVISFNIEGVHSYDLGMMLDKLGIAVRTGHLCADTVMQHYQITSTTRISFGMYNTIEEIDSFLKALEKVIPMLK